MADSDNKPKTEPENESIKNLEIEGYKFEVDTDLMDDVEAFGYIDSIENKGNSAGIVPLLKFLIGDKGFEDMKAHFTELDAKEHKGQKDYKPRWRASKLVKVYTVIAENFDPKD